MQPRRRGPAPGTAACRRPETTPGRPGASQSSTSTATWSARPFLEAESDQVASGELQQLGRPGADGHQAAAGSAPDPADREDRAALIHAAEVPPATGSRAPGSISVKKTSTLPEVTSQTAPGSSSARGRFAAVRSGQRERQQLLDQEPGRLPSRSAEVSYPPATAGTDGKDRCDLACRHRSRAVASARTTIDRERPLARSTTLPAVRQGLVRDQPGVFSLRRRRSARRASRAGRRGRR